MEKYNTPPGANKLLACFHAPFEAGEHELFTSASIGISFANSDVVKYIALPFASALPATFPSPIVYAGQRFNYYIRVQ